MKLWFWVGQWQENNKWLPTRESAARRTVRSPDSLQKAALINYYYFELYTHMQGLSFLTGWSLNVCTNTDAQSNLPSIPFIKPGAVSLLGPPAGWQRRRVHQTTGRRTTPRSTPEKSQMHCFNTRVSLFICVCVCCSQRIFWTNAAALKRNNSPQCLLPR